MRNRMYFNIVIVLAYFMTYLRDGFCQHSGVGQVADNLMEPVSLFSDFIYTGCFIIGASFLFATLIKYIEHKRSPLMVPISTVIFLLIAGLVLILLPFASYLTDSGVKYVLFK